VPRPGARRAAIFIPQSQHSGLASFFQIRPTTGRRLRTTTVWLCFFRPSHHSTTPVRAGVIPVGRSPQSAGFVFSGPSPAGRRLRTTTVWLCFFGPSHHSAPPLRAGVTFRRADRLRAFGSFFQVRHPRPGSRGPQRFGFVLSGPANHSAPPVRAGVTFRRADRTRALGLFFQGLRNRTAEPRCGTGRRGTRGSGFVFSSTLVPA
jgi:hypothetical protein